MVMNEKIVAPYIFEIVLWLKSLEGYPLITKKNRIAFSNEIMCKSIKINVPSSGSSSSSLAAVIK